MSFDFCSEKKTEIMNKSQSLSSRAMSFDLQKELNSQGIFLDEAEKTTNQVIEWVKENPGKTVGIVAGAAAVYAGLAFLAEKFLGGSDE